MNATVVALTRSGVSILSRAQDFAELTKPRISVLVSMTVATAMCMAFTTVNAMLILHASFATALVAASASVFNQLIERKSDGKMIRTADRPITAGRISFGEALSFGLTLLAAGTIYLLVTTNWQTAALGVATWLLYVGIYTPLKRLSTWNTFVGAFPGAMPVLMGWAATGEQLDQRAWLLFVLVFAWQFPHFMAIAWRCRKQYAAAGLKMLTVTDPTGTQAAIVGVVCGILVIPVSCYLAISMNASWAVLLIFAGTGIWQLKWALHFQKKINDDTARGLLRASLVYLPVVLIGAIVTTLT